VYLWELLIGSTLKIGYIGIKGLPSQAGADRVVEAIVQHLSKEHELTVYCSSLVVSPNTTYPGVELIRVPVLRGKHLHAITLFFFSTLHALTRDFDLIHLHNLEASFTLVLLKLRYKVIVTIHGESDYDNSGRLEIILLRINEWLIRLADSITNVSESHIEDNRIRFRRTVYFIPNGVYNEETNIDLTSARELLHSYNAKPNNYILFAAGRVIPTKSASTLLEAYRKITTEIKLLIVGIIRRKWVAL